MNQPDPIFTEEVLANLDAMAQALTVILAEGSGHERINAIFRHAHSIKGGAAAFGFGNLAEMMHQAETLLDQWRSGRLQPDEHGVALLLESVALAREGMTAPVRDPPPAQALLASLQAAAHVQTPREIKRHRQIRIAGPCRPVVDNSVAALFRDIAGLGVLLSVAGVGASARVFTVQTSVSDAELLDLLAMLADRDSIVIGDALPVSEDMQPDVVLGSLDPAGASLGLVGQNDMPQRHRTVAELSPVSELFALAPALLANLTRTLGKSFTLEMTGDSLRLERRVIQGLADPLVQLVRNACDHGIESAQDRRAAGKPGDGRIALSAALRDGMLELTVRDDGRGLSRSMLLQAAHARGIAVAADAPDQAVWPLVFAPGLTTARTVTSVSGRGVGMDVVRSKVAALGGTVEIESVPGTGTRVVIRVPVAAPDVRQE